MHKILLQILSSEGWMKICDFNKMSDTAITYNNFLNGWYRSETYFHSSNLYIAVDMNLKEILYVGETCRNGRGPLRLKQCGTEPYQGRSTERLNDYVGESTDERGRVDVVIERLNKGHKVVLLIKPLVMPKATECIAGEMIEAQANISKQAERTLLDKIEEMYGEIPIGNKIKG